jgi:MFS family permease
MAQWMRRSERGLASGLIHSGSGLGGTLAPVLVAWIVAGFGWREAFVVSGIITFGVTVWWWWQSADDPARHPRVSDEELAIIAADKEEMASLPLDLPWFKQLAVNRNGYLLCLSEFFYGLGGFVFLTWFYTYFKEERQAGEMYSGFLSSCNYLALAIAAPIGGLLCDRCVRRWGNPWGRRAVPLVSIILSGVCTIIAPTFENHTASAAMFAVSCGFLFAAAPAFWSTLIDITRRGTGVLGGLMNGAGSLGGALGTMYFARLLPILGYERSLQCAGLMAIVSGLVWLGLDASKQIDAVAENGSRKGA